MGITLNWTNKSPEYMEALDSYVEHIFKYVEKNSLDLSQVSSLSVAAAAESVSILLDPATYLRNQLLKEKSKEQLVDDETARAFVDVQAERFKWILEDMVSRDFNIPIKLLRQRRLDS